MQTYLLEGEVELTKSNVMERLINWYLKFCDGIWEHSQGIEISTIDNPGFRIKINLKGCGYNCSFFEEIDWECAENPEQDWIHCLMKDEIWYGYGSPNNFCKLISIFIDWEENECGKLQAEL